MPAYRTPTGELLRSLRLATYRQVVDLLAEPREHVSYREIARVCSVGGHTVKAIERAEAESIVERRAKLVLKVTRVAERAWSTVEDKLDDANLAQATICAGIATGEAPPRPELQALDAEVVSSAGEVELALQDRSVGFPAPD